MGTVWLVLYTDGPEGFYLAGGEQIEFLSMRLDELPWPRLPVEGEFISVAGSFAVVFCVYFWLSGELEISLRLPDRGTLERTLELIDFGFQIEEMPVPGKS